jgi:hypothetical protein
LDGLPLKLFSGKQSPKTCLHRNLPASPEIFVTRQWR